MVLLLSQPWLGSQERFARARVAVQASHPRAVQFGDVFSRKEPTGRADLNHTERWLVDLLSWVDAETCGISQSRTCMV